MDLTLFVVHLKYTDLERLEQYHAEHAEWIEREVEAGTILLAGAVSTYDSGVLLARAPSRAALETILKEDAFYRAGIETYEIVEFRPRRGTLRRFPENPLYLDEAELQAALAENWTGAV